MQKNIILIDGSVKRSIWCVSFFVCYLIGLFQLVIAHLHCSQIMFVPNTDNLDLDFFFVGFNFKSRSQTHLNGLEKKNEKIR
jgi:hypothetical protein